MAKKFFYDKVHNTKRTITNLIIIGVCVIGIIICFIITSNFQGENNSKNAKVNIKTEVMVEVNDKFKNDIFFSKVENFDVDKLDITYPDNYDISKIGSYDVNIKIDKENYKVKLNVVDTIKPELELKELTISKGNPYKANDFVVTCTDNSKNDCIIDFYKDGTDQDGNNVDYSNFTEVGTYSVKISATDNNKNQVVEETRLNITEPNSNIPANPATCKYGSSNYNKEEFLIAVDITTNGCAISLDLYKDAKVTEELNKLMDTETIKIQKDIGSLDLKGTLALNRKVAAVVNNEGSGIVGYQLEMTVTLSKNGNPKVIAEYKVDSKGNRVYSKNTYNLK